MTPPAPTSAVVISHSSIVEGNLATVFAMIAQNLATDIPYIMQLSPSSKTATILIATELSLASISAILAGLSGIHSTPPPAA